MNSQWLKTEHDRLHIVELWPEGPHKQAALAAIWSKIASLTLTVATKGHHLECEICLSRQTMGIVRFPVPGTGAVEQADIAA